MKRLAALAAVVLVLGGCEDQQTPAQQQASARANLERLTAQLDSMPGSKIVLDDGTLKVFRDRANGVTCWSRWDYPQTLSCMPDWMLLSPKPTDRVFP